MNTPNKYNRYTLATLAASIALATGSTAAMAAAAPAATQLPGQGKVVAGSALDAGTGIVNGHQTIDIDGHAVINWGTSAGATLNATGQPAGFNIGSDAVLTFNGTSEDAVLNIDTSGNPSQIFGTLNGTDANVFVANPNGIVVGKGASISSTGEVGLIANVLGANAAFGGDIADVVYNGTGGDVTVQAGASIEGSTVWVAGGGNVNVDLGSLTGGDVTLNAGLGQSGDGFATSNKNANLSVSGQLDGASIAGFHSAGNASNEGVLDLTDVGSKTDSSVGGLSVGGTFTNKGDLTLPHRNDLSVVNDGQLTTEGSGNGQSAARPTFTSLINNGNYQNSGDDVTVSGGDLVNNGTIDLGDAGAGGHVLLVGDGKVNNHGTMENVANLTTQYNADTVAGTNVGINNDGIISGTLTYVNAGESYLAAGVQDKFDVSGNFTNSGSLIFTGGGTGFRHRFLAHDGISMAGSLMLMEAGGSAKAISAKNPLTDAFGLYALNGTVRMAAELAFTNNAESLSNTGTGFSNAGATFQGRQVELMSNIIGVSSDNSDTVNVIAGGAPDSGYAVRVGNGVTVSAGMVAVGAQQATDVKGRPITGYGHPNIVLQGTLSGDDVVFGTNDAPVADVFSGPNGSIHATGDSPKVTFNFTGAIKNAPYTNGNNFRYNYLPITVADADADAVRLILNPVAYETNGTSNGKSAVNILVNGGVDLHSGLAGIDTISDGGSAVTGVTNLPNTHLVLQSTGDIAITNGNFYWPGYVYLGNIGTNADGSAAPGTLGLGQISLDGDFNNVLPGDVSGAAGVHFITQRPLDLNGTVTTNANSWVNFATDTLTAAYATGALGDGQFFGGTQAAGAVVNYGALDASMFHLQEPVAGR